jgi:hypothetical protein
VLIESQANLTSLALTVVDILLRDSIIVGPQGDPSGPILMGERLMEAHIRYESRAKSRRVLVSCPPQDVGKVFVQRGHRLRNNHDEDAPILEFRYREIVTIMRFRDRDPDQHLFATCVLTRAFPARVDDAPSSA